MTTLREAAQQALEALEHFYENGYDREDCFAAITTLRERLAQPEPRPIHECYGDCPTNPQTCPNPCNFEGRPRPVQEPVTRLFGTLPVYDTPPQRKPLSEDEAWGLIEQDSRMEEYGSVAMELIRAVERAHGIT